MEIHNICLVDAVFETKEDGRGLRNIMVQEIVKWRYITYVYYIRLVFEIKVDAVGPLHYAEVGDNALMTTYFLDNSAPL